MLELRDRIGILLVYINPAALTLPELAKLVSGIVLKTTKLVVLGNLNIYAKAHISGTNTGCHGLHDNHGPVSGGN